MLLHRALTLIFLRQIRVNVIRFKYGTTPAEKAIAIQAYSARETVSHVPYAR